VASGTENTIRVFFGHGDGSFEPASLLATGQTPDVLVATDLDGDGVPDLAVSEENGDTVSLVTGTGGRAFTPRRAFPVGRGPVGLAAADLDLDGRPELLAARYFSEGLVVLRNAGNGNFLAP
jgi:hypothetical protein